MNERQRFGERRELVARDLDELAEQVGSGEVEPETAAELERSYRAELAELDARLEELGEEPEPVVVEREPDPSPPASSRSPRRVFTGAAVLIVALTLAIFFVARDSEPGGGNAPGAGNLLIDPANVTNEELEAVVADNPQITAMRMALADRYFDAEEYGSALSHYLFIAENTRNRTEESRALARVGWMAYITDQAEAADEYMMASLAADPTNSEAILFRGFVTMYGLGDPQSAIPQLEAALELTNLADSVVDQIEAALAEARGTPDDG